MSERRDESFNGMLFETVPYGELSRRDIMARYFNLSAPIGHSGVPFPQQVYQTERASDIGKESVFKRSSGGEEILGEKILNLPIEIKVEITKNLSQYDLVNLASVSKSFYDAAMFSLYENVVVDASYSILNDSLRTDKNLRCTYIKTRYNLKKFMKSLCADELETAFPLGILVKSLKIINLPDGVSNSEIVNFVHKSIQSLSRLSCLYWESGSRKLPLDTLKYLPNKKELTSLGINLDLSKCGDSKIEFPQLERLSVVPFNNSETLCKFMNQISIDKIADRIRVLQLGRQLASMKQINKSNLNLGQSLIVTKYMIDNNLPRPDAVGTDYTATMNGIDFEFWDFLNPIVQDEKLNGSRRRRFKQLEILDIDSVNILANDSEKVISAINLSKLHTLSLNNVNEIQWLPEVDFQLTDFTSAATENFRKGLLISIAPHLKHLKQLRLDYQEAYRDSIPQFLGLLAKNNVLLDEIDLTITWDDSKLATVMSWEKLMENYATAICKHSSTLKKLSIVTKESLRYCDVPKQIPVDSVLKLTQCTKLESLRINGDSLQPSGIHLLHKFPRLRFLSLCGESSGGPRHMGLQMAHDGIMDDWYRVMHVALTLAQANKNLQFVKIDRCLFECGKSGNAIPRPDVLNDWFTKQTRVTISEDQF
ncbi:conserved hypothetical protein [Kluyveromyces marxianus]|uniref:F-box domain-containing protein n=1 Tax=Kluyveromyces marxianus (strain DMKU3-1042 / BCC 29191 / NBRC 104275) TaxID=1003335 RepID=W0T4L1_KLUMD|nr:uncharacterized protein KLMA_20089 [Kluyveromyces marxianus DMKU3-1042]BAO38547.1 conserved hypothetical protein [Kluyveromyces marxianus DMKU3-1042]BAP70095.1 conserved hypothetical protein [Kluyveromyces marxianus]